MANEQILTQEKMSVVLKKGKNNVKRCVILYPGDVVIRKSALKSWIHEIEQLEDQAYAYRYLRKYEP